MSRGSPLDIETSFANLSSYSSADWIFERQYIFWYELCIWIQNIICFECALVLPSILFGSEISLAEITHGLGGTAP